MSHMHAKRAGGGSAAAGGFGVIDLDKMRELLIKAKRPPGTPTSDKNWLGRGKGQLIDMFSYRRMKRDKERGVFGVSFWIDSFDYIRRKAMGMKRPDLKGAFRSIGTRIVELFEVARDYIRS